MVVNLNVGGKNYVWNRPVVMGIVNVTPDSFYSGSRVFSKDSIIRNVENMVNAGADIIDIGAYSSRPGADVVPEEEEIRRLAVFFDSIAGNYGSVVFSLDTFRANVARFVLEKYRSVIVNDISGGRADMSLMKVASDFSVPYILMHMRGAPHTMQRFAQYGNVCYEVIDELQEQVAAAVGQGVHDIIVDPGFGFSKTAAHNYQLLARLSQLKVIGKPILVGLSRKSMIYSTLAVDPSEALNGTSALHMLALHNGANILRVHDVKEAVEVVALYGAVEEYNEVSNCEIPWL